MTDIENDYTPDPREAREFRKTSTTLLKGFAGQTNFQKSNDFDLAEAIALSPELLALTKQVWIATDMDLEKTYWAVATVLKNSGVSLPKIDDTTRTAIGSVTGGQVPKKKLPSEVEEGVEGSIAHHSPNSSPGMPSAQVSTQGRDTLGRDTYQGYTPQRNIAGTDLNSKDTTSYTSPIGRVSTPEAQNLRAAGGQNPTYGVGEGERGQIGSPGQSGQYEGRGHLPYSSISQKPGDARTTYVTRKSGSLEIQPKEKVETITKSRHLESPKTEPFDTFLIKHMTGALFKASNEELLAGRGITAESVNQSMHEEDEARELEARPRLEEARREEDEVDEADERAAQKFESEADELVRKARQFELTGDWKTRDEYLYLSKLKRAQAVAKMRAISTRHGNRNFPTGL